MDLKVMLEWTLIILKNLLIFQAHFYKSTFHWIWLDKRKNVSEKIYSRRRNAWVLSCFLICNIRFLLLKQTKSSQFEFFFFSFFVSAKKNVRKKVAKQRNLTWGHVKTFIGDCSIFRFLLPSHKNCFRVPWA